MSAAGGALVAWAAAVAAVSLWACRPQPRRSPTTAPKTRALLLRPCRGDEPHLDETLRSTRAVLHPPHEVAIRFAIESREDAAFPAATRAAAALRAEGADAAVVVTGAVGPNRKADQLSRVIEGESMSDVVVVVDSDVQLIGDELDALLDALGAPGVEAAWMPAVETSRETLGDRASAAVLDTSLHAFTLLSRLDGGGFVGKVMAVRHDALERVGGFGSLVRYLGEDVELGRRLRASGGATRVASGRAEARTSGRLVRDVIGRYARWIQVVRAQRPWLLATYPAIVAATPLLVAATLGTLAFDPGSAAAALALALGSRALVAIVARRRGARREGLVRLPADALMADVLLLAAFVRALVGGPVSWRGRRLRWGDGELDQEASSVGGPCG